MGDKSYVTMERKVCPACGKEFGTGAVLLDSRMRDRFEKETTTGWGLCPEDARKVTEGYVILVGATAPAGRDRLAVDEAERTGDLIHLRREVAEDIFNLPEIPDMMFVEPEVVAMLKKMADKVSGYGAEADYGES